MPAIQSAASERKPEHDDDETSDLVWGSREIGRLLNRSPEQVVQLFRAGKLKGAVGKLGHRTMVGFKSKLKNLPALKQDRPAASKSQKNAETKEIA